VNTFVKTLVLLFFTWSSFVALAESNREPLVFGDYVATYMGMDLGR